MIKGLLSGLESVQGLNAIGSNLGGMAGNPQVDSMLASSMFGGSDIDQQGPLKALAKIIIDKQMAEDGVEDNLDDTAFNEMWTLFNRE